MISAEALEVEMARIRQVVGERIREARAQRGMTLAELEERSGLNRAILSRLENGEHSPRFFTVLRVGVALGLELPELLDAKPEREIKRKRSRNGSRLRAMKP